MFFDSAQGLFRVVALGVPVYITLVLLLRVCGKRTLSKMNAFDLVVTVAIGSTLGSVLTSNTIPMAEGIAALALLAGLQFTIAWLSVRFHMVQSLVKSEPRLLYYEGRFIESSLRDERVTPEEVRAAVRMQGLVSMEQVRAVVLETSGEFSVTHQGAADESALADLTRRKAA